MSDFRAEWRRGRECLDAARLCQRNGFYADAVSRAYYAVMHAAKAALELHGVTARSHSAVIRLFGRYILAPGLVEKEWAKEIGELSDLRIIADYNAEAVSTEADSRAACDRAGAFLNRIHVCCPMALLPPPSPPSRTPTPQSRRRNTARRGRPSGRPCFYCAIYPKTGNRAKITGQSYSAMLIQAVPAMKIKYHQDTDTLHIELYAAEEGPAQSLDEDTTLGLDGKGRLRSVTIQHASDRIDLPSLKRVSGNPHGVLNLTADEQGWLDEYRRQLQERFPGLVEDIIIYGPYARGISDPDVEWDMLMIIREGDRQRKYELSSLANKVDLDGHFFCSPLIRFYTKAEWEENKRIGGGVYQLATSEGISVL